MRAKGKTTMKVVHNAYLAPFAKSTPARGDSYEPGRKAGGEDASKARDNGYKAAIAIGGNPRFPGQKRGTARNYCWRKKKTYETE
jgi:hypothetical protein